MMQQTEARAQGVAAVAYVPGATVAFYQDGSATITEAYTLECTRCGALHDVEGETATYGPLEAWHLAQAFLREPERGRVLSLLAAIMLRQEEGAGA